MTTGLLVACATLIAVQAFVIGQLRENERALRGRLRSLKRTPHPSTIVDEIVECANPPCLTLYPRRSGVTAGDRDYCSYRCAGQPMWGTWRDDINATRRQIEEEPTVPLFDQDADQEDAP